LFYATEVIAVYEDVVSPEDCCLKCQKEMSCDAFTFGLHNETTPGLADKCHLKKVDGCPTFFPNTQMSVVSGMPTDIGCFTSSSSTTTAPPTTTTAIPTPVSPAIPAIPTPVPTTSSTTAALIPAVPVVPQVIHTVHETTAAPPAPPATTHFIVIPTPEKHDVFSGELLWWLLAVLLVTTCCFCLIAATIVKVSQSRSGGSQTYYVKEVHPNYNVVLPTKEEKRNRVQAETLDRASLLYAAGSSPPKEYAKSREKYSQGFAEGAAHALKHFGKPSPTAGGGSVPPGTMGVPGTMGGPPGSMGPPPTAPKSTSFVAVPAGAWQPPAE
jgi:hypothetical protein